MIQKNINRLNNLESLIAKIKELDEKPEATGFVLVAIDKPNAPISFTVTTKNTSSITVIGALEEFKHGFMSAFTKSEKG